METYIALFLLIIPGYLAKTVNGHLCDNINTNDKFLLTMQALLYDLAIMPIVYFIIHSWTADVDNVRLFFSDMKNIIIYGICAVFVSIAVGAMWKWGLLLYQWIINQFRGNNIVTIGKSVFDISFNDGKVHLVEIYKDNKFICGGYLISMYYDNKELLLLDAQEVFALLNESGVKKYKEIYFDYGSGMVIKEIDMEMKKE